MVLGWMVEVGFWCWIGVLKVLDLCDDAGRRSRLTRASLSSI